MNIAKFANQS